MQFSQRVIDTHAFKVFPFYSCIKDFVKAFKACRKDKFYDWSMKCLRRAVRRQHPIVKRMYKDMKEHPYKFPEK